MQYGAGHQVNQEELQEIALRLKRDGKVTFVTYDSWLSDHVVEPPGLCGRCTGVAVPLRVVPSPTGLPLKRGPGLGSF